MTFDPFRLDKLSFDDFEDLIDAYIEDAIDTFVESDIGQAHVKIYPEGGSWIYHFLDKSLCYEGIPPTKLSKSNVQTIMEYWLPRKLLLSSPDEVEDAIPELIAFWSFLKENYKVRRATEIIKYFKSIEKQFSRWMFDPSRAGIGKAIMAQAMQSGYDLTNKDDLQAFQDAQQTNPLQQLPQVPKVSPQAPKSSSKSSSKSSKSSRSTKSSKSSSKSPKSSSKLSKSPKKNPLLSLSNTPTTLNSNVPLEMEETFKLLGLPVPTIGDTISPIEIVHQLLNATVDADEETMRRVKEIIDGSEDDSEE